MMMREMKEEEEKEKEGRTDKEIKRKRQGES